jgi:hypothetical protein
MIDRDRNTLNEGDVVEDAAGLLWLVRNDGLKRRDDWLPIEKASDMRVVYSEPGLSREQRTDLGLVFSLVPDRQCSTCGFPARSGRIRPVSEWAMMRQKQRR